MLLPPVVFGLLWLGLCYWVSGNIWGRRIVCALAAMAFFGFIATVLADRFLFPQMEARNQVPRNSITVQLRALGLGALLGAAISPLLARFGTAYWIFQIGVVAAYILLPWMPLSH